MLGLKAARELNDMDGLRWASLGILNQAWTKDHTQVWQAGVGVAKEIFQRMKTDKRDKEAEGLPGGNRSGGGPGLRGGRPLDRRRGRGPDGGRTIRRRVLVAQPANRRRAVLCWATCFRKPGATIPAVIRKSTYAPRASTASTV